MCPSKLGAVLHTEHQYTLLSWRCLMYTDIRLRKGGPKKNIYLPQRKKTKKGVIAQFGRALALHASGYVFKSR